MLIYFFSVLLTCAAAPSLVLTEAIETDIAFTSVFDQSVQQYVLWQPASVTQLQGTGILIALHGHGSDRWQFIRDERGECRAVRDMARKHSLVVIAPDYRATTSWMGPAAESDVLQIIQEYKKQHAPNRVFLTGGSMGAASALTFAALHPECVDGIVAMNGIANHIEYTNFQEAIAASFGGDKNNNPDEYAKRSAEYHADRLTMPIVCTIGDADKTTPPQSIMRLADRLKSLGRNVLIIQDPNGGHETSYEDACKAIEHLLLQCTAKATADRQNATPLSPAE
jgi:pimeloyl-ACP methyl ester carboxylesterase